MDTNASHEEKTVSKNLPLDDGWIRSAVGIPGLGSIALETRRKSKGILIGLGGV
jgi:hypothetical protein